MSTARIPADWEVARLRILLALMWMGFLLLGIALWRIQIVHGRRFEKDLAQQSIRRVRIPAVRGRLYDRHGRLLAESRPSFDVVLYLEEIRHTAPRGRFVERIEALLDELAVRLERPRRVTREEILVHMRRRLPLPLTAWEDLDERAVARWAEQAIGLPGVDLAVSSRRRYPEGDLAAHVLGTVGRAEFPFGEGEPEEPFHYYLPDIEGRKGIEAVYDERLRGESGGRMVRVDVVGFRHEDLGGRAPEAGRDLLLTIDRDVQRAAEAALGGATGAAVVLDPRTGDVLAMASSPRFDPNAFVPAIPVPEWRALLDDPRQPLFHRAAAGMYAPGSVFKPVTALAALRAGAVSPQTEISCGGVFSLGRAAFRCWERSGHGPLRLDEAIRVSCNVYFYRAALSTGIGPLAEMARELGLGSRTGIDLDVESAGLVPDDAWKRSRLGDAWRDGDTCNLSIGQGPLLVTPLQMAVLTAALANGGVVRRPRLLLGDRLPGHGPFDLAAPPQGRRADSPAPHIEWVRAAMRDAVMSPDGTARRARVPGVVVAGKTGTAEYGRKEDGLRRGWMAAFAPFEAPRFAVVVMVDEAVSGGITAAPMVQQILAALFSGPPQDPGAGVEP